MPVIDCLEMTLQAVADCLAQTVPTRVLIVNQGSRDATREALEALAERSGDRVLVWSHLPTLPSLSATWNRALEFVWACGAEHALVVNNDVRLHRQTVEVLQKTLASTEALFVTAVGVREGQFQPDAVYDPVAGTDEGWLTARSARGGPDFSCFLISALCHVQYRFDEAFIPAYCEDLDYHRRLMLGGDGARIFSVNLPYLHYASGTTKAFTQAQREHFAQRVKAARGHYERKWGGPVNEETFVVPFTRPAAPLTGITTPELQAAVQAGKQVPSVFLARFVRDVPDEDGLLLGGDEADPLPGQLASEGL
jgi:GT2 family glycosyltransferase